MKTEYAKLIQYFDAKGWTPSTSSNFSFRDAETCPDNSFWVSRSGVDKSLYSAADFMLVDNQIKILKTGSPTDKPSAEALLHATVYAERPGVNVVAHTHSVNLTVLSYQLGLAERRWEVQGLEMQKSLTGVDTHDDKLSIPVFANSQDMNTLSTSLAAWLKTTPAGPPGCLIAGHGLYAWGEDLAQVKRHVDGFEFLGACTLQCHYYGLALPAPIKPAD